MGETCFAKVLKMRRINWTFERKGNVKERRDGGDFSFMLLLFSLDSSKRFSSYSTRFFFWKGKTFLREIVTVFSREITYINVYKISYLVTSMSRRIYIYIRKSSLFNGDINIYFTLKVDPNLPWNLGEINVSKKKKGRGMGEGKERMRRQAARTVGGI